jgi:pyruvate dehydrogenase E2 component (dihydrolipoamide acetyltransferase)
MPIELKMPALSPTMEEGTLAKWLVKEGDSVSSGDLLAEIETDKATMEFEAIDDGTIAKILVPEGSEGVKVGAVIALIAAEGEEAGDAGPAPAKADAVPAKAEAPPAKQADEPTRPTEKESAAPALKPAAADQGDRVKASPLARRLAEQQGVDLSNIKGSGPGGRVVKADLEGAGHGTAAPATATESAAPASAPAAAAVPVASETPSEQVRLSQMRKTIARRMTESKTTVPHFYLTIDCNLDALLKLRAEINAGLENRGIKLSVNDLLIKALGVALEQVPDANVSYAGDTLIRYQRADISMAVAIPGGLITPIITDAGGKSLSKIATEAKDLAARARDGKLQPHEYQGGTASISNLGMYGIKQFDAVVNPPQGMIMAVGAGEKRPYVVNDALAIATVMSASGSFDHRAIDGAIGAELMAAFKALVEKPLGMVA